MASSSNSDLVFALTSQIEFEAMVEALDQFVANCQTAEAEEIATPKQIRLREAAEMVLNQLNTKRVNLAT